MPGTYDPAWDMPQNNWQQQGAFEAGSIPPVVEPDAGTQIMLGPVAEEWMPWACGALDVLRNPSNWIVADDDAMYDTLRRVDTFLGLICGQREVCVPTMTRLEDCVLQTSTDGGTTWVDVPGWTDNFQNCVQDVLPPPPPQLPGSVINQRACNIAGFLATSLIQTALENAVTDWNNDVRLFSQGTVLFNDLLSEAFPLTNLALLAGNDIFAWFAAGTIDDLQAASTDPTLWAEVTCAIYTAIRFDGEVTDGNYAAVVAEICALTYTPTVAINAICSFVTALGAVNLRSKQVGGAFDVIDCTACAGWCLYFDFTTSDGGWFVPDGTFGTYVAGHGWESQLNDLGNREILIQFALGDTFAITDMQLRCCAPTDSGGQARKWYLKEAGVDIGNTDISPGVLPCGSGSGWHSIGLSGDKPQLVFRSAGDGPPDIIQSIEIAGTGTPPAGANNCVYDPGV